MFDAFLRPIIDPPLNRLGKTMVQVGINANMVTIVGLILGLIAAFAISQGAFIIALIFILLSRLADGLDGAVARASRKTDRGGYLDIVFDFIFYGIIPLSFVLYDPIANGLAGAFLIFTFYANGASFLAYAIMAEKQDKKSQKHGMKSLYFTGGLAEGFETIIIFCAFCLLPSAFAIIAYCFAIICIITTISRILLAWQTFE